MFNWLKREKRSSQDLNSVNRWHTIARVREPDSGFWQRNKELTIDEGLSYPTVFACINRIAEDVAKMGLHHEKKDSNGIYKQVETDKNKLLRNPNSYQTRQQFLQAWEVSIQGRGNAYILLDRIDGKVKAMHVLNASTTRPLVSPSGAVYYEIGADDLANVNEDRVVPASEIIHDRINCLYHPLVGLSPLYAVALTLMKSRSIQQQGHEFFKNGATPSGVIVIPAPIDEKTAREIEERWNARYSEKRGATGVLGDGAKYETITQTAEDSQLIDQLRFSAAEVCSVFKVPQFKVGVGDLPTYDNTESLNTAYFTDCIQSRMLSIQNALNKGLDIPSNESFRFDIESLILLDTKSKMKVTADGMGGIYSPNEARKRFNLPPVSGGESPYLQQQNFSLEALAKRDAKEDPFIGSNRYSSNNDPPKDPIEPTTEPPAEKQDIKGLGLMIRGALSK